MLTRYANRTIEENFDLLDLKQAKAGLAQYNPFVLNKTVAEAYEAVVDVLGASGLMVIADNHMSQPRWCCSLDDGNGFFGNNNFDPQEWLQGLSLVAQRFRNKSTVVGMSLRNEIRGFMENANDWNKYITQGVTTIHNINSEVLVIVSGLNYDNDLRCLKEKPLNVSTLDNKLVFEVHLYSFSGDSESKFVKQPLNNICANIMNGFIDHVGFVMQGPNPFPLFVSEYGYDQREVNDAENRFMSCFTAHLTQRDLDWALWAWQGSYYFREGQAEPGESFGVLDSNWTQIKNPNFVRKFQLLQTMLQDPNSNASFSYVIYHPQSSQCIQVSNDNKEIFLTNCSTPTRWSHNNDGTPIEMSSTGLYLKASGKGLEASLSSDTLSQQSVWSAISNSKLHLATFTQGGKSLCLQIDSSNSSKVVTNSCICTNVSKIGDGGEWRQMDVGDRRRRGDVEDRRWRGDVEDRRWRGDLTEMDDTRMKSDIEWSSHYWRR
ncbi:glycosyl hydrolase 5 family protein-like [Cucumis sativus]|uniref:glycosyl hydrolase 5 family protein-like n=1 Tax=Cucumis sativus TaxID=3659 RepID=UPI0012F4B9EB|nr:glycosyl hydrolase 5 family protein-like [Cucumis sativus]